MRLYPSTPFNLHPLQSGTPTLAPGSGEAGLPHISLSGPENSKRLRIEYIRRKGPPDPGLAYQPLFSDHLDPGGPWSQSSNPESATPINDYWERVIVEDHHTGGARRFARVKVTPTE